MARNVKRSSEAAAWETPAARIAHSRGRKEQDHRHRRQPEQALLASPSGHRTAVRQRTSRLERTFSASRTSWISPIRCFASFWRQRRITLANASGHVAASAPVGLARSTAASVSDDVLAREAPPARQHLEEHAAERPDVARVVDTSCRAPAPGSCTPRCRGSCPRRVIAGVVIVGDCDDRRARARASGLHRFREAEVQHLHRAVGPHLDVRGLEIAVDDPLLVRRFERLGDLLRDRQRFVERESAPARCGRRASAPRPAPSPAR